MEDRWIVVRYRVTRYRQMKGMLQQAEEKRRLVYVLPQDARLCTDNTTTPALHTLGYASPELRKCDLMYTFQQT